LIKNILRKETKVKKVLDLGSRDQILKKFLPDNFIYTGIDIMQNKDNDNILMDLNKKILFEDNSYDYVFCLDIMEHLDDPISFLKESYRICSKKIFIVLPNIAYYEKRISFLLSGDLGNKYHFSGNKFEDRHKWFTNYFLISKFFKKNSVNYEIYNINKTRNKLKFIMYLEKILSKLMPNVFSWSYLIIINKN
jgi:predicted SAM-dependent methyltransferase